MLCPKCGKEMRKGYLFSSKDGYQKQEFVDGEMSNVEDEDDDFNVSDFGDDSDFSDDEE